MHNSREVEVKLDTGGCFGRYIFSNSQAKCLAKFQDWPTLFSEDFNDYFKPIFPPQVYTSLAIRR